LEPAGWTGEARRRGLGGVVSGRREGGAFSITITITIRIAGGFGGRFRVARGLVAGFCRISPVSHAYTRALFPPPLARE